MLIGIISDTHDRTASTEAVLTFLATQKIDALLHLGDWTTQTMVQRIADFCSELVIPGHGVLGNNDRVLQPGRFGALTLHGSSFKIKLDGQVLAGCHGHDTKTSEALERLNPDVLCRGHSHKPQVEKRGNIQWINPGSTAFSIPRSKNWLPTCALYDTQTREAVLHLIAV